MTQAKYERLVDAAARDGERRGRVLGRRGLDPAGPGGQGRARRARRARDGRLRDLSGAASWRRPSGWPALLGLRHLVVRTEELAESRLRAQRRSTAASSARKSCSRSCAPIAEREGCRHARLRRQHGRPRRPPAGHEVRAPSAGCGRPLIEAELWKAEIRELSRELGLPTWDKPSFACLSSRFQYGDRITAEKLRQVDAAEAFVRSLGFRQFRVRHHDRLARLEIPLDDDAAALGGRAGTRRS